jgi:hypothetical protein
MRLHPFRAVRPASDLAERVAAVPYDVVSRAEAVALADALALMGRQDEAAEVFKRLLNIRNDVGLLAEEYDVGERRLVGNFPQAFSHVALIHAAASLAEPETAHPRARG